jgi:hypothetical protein
VSTPAEALADRRADDGGYGPSVGAEPEPEPTTLSAVALGDVAAAAWLERAQADDGAVGVRAPGVFRDVTGPALLGLPAGPPRERALDLLVGARGVALPSTEASPHDPSLRGWAWTQGEFAWVEPTAWAVLALRQHDRPGPELDDGLAVLADRECVGGGWNYGNRVVFDEELAPYVQTTALGLIALNGVDDALATRGLTWLEGAWEEESDGVLSLATAAAAFRLFGSRQAGPATRALARSLDRDLPQDTVALAWAVIALSDAIHRLEVAS